MFTFKKKKAKLAHKDGGQNRPLPKRSSIKMAQFQNGPRAETAHIKNGPLLWRYLKIIRFFYRHFDYEIVFFFFHSDFTNNTNFGVMNTERMPAKICKFVVTFLPVDLY